MPKVYSNIFETMSGTLKHLNFRIRRGNKIELGLKRIPANPRTEKQLSQREKYKNCVEQWNQLSEEEKQQYNLLATKEQLSGYHLFMRDCLKGAAPAEVWYSVLVDNTNNSNTLTDFQVLLVVSGDQQFFTDFNNDLTTIEAYDSDKTTPISFYVEEWDTNNYNAKIWLKIPSIPANSTKTVYLKPNPNRTTPLSDPNTVFDLWDDFITNTISSGKWQVVAGEWHIETENSLIWNDDTEYARIKSQFNDVGNFIYELNTRHDEADTTSWAGIQIKSPSTDYDTYDQGYLILHYGNDGRTRIFRADSGSLTELAYNIIEIPQGEWFVLKVIYTDGTIKAYINDELITQATDNTYQSGEVIRIWNNNQAQKTSYDLIRVRKYTDPEPTVTYQRTIT